MDKYKALTRAAALCSAGEQCSGDIHDKLLRWGCPEEDAAEIVARLVGERFIDDTRYALAFTHDRIRYARWGRVKIQYALRQKGIDGEAIATALRAIDDEWSEEYGEALRHTLAKCPVDSSADYETRQRQRARQLRHAASHGFTAAECRE